MRSSTILTVILIVVYIIIGILHLTEGKYPHVLYWIGAAILTIGVLNME